MPAERRTRREFQSTENVWDLADNWAAQTGYHVVEQDNTSRLYQRGPGIRYQGAAQMVQITATQDAFVLEAWISIHISRITRILNTSSYIAGVPDEMPIGSGGGAALATSARARKDVNILLHHLSVQPLVS
jgi:hypothetical protein